MMTNCELKVGARQKGFTLIEMSIVLVIIGLIIGGILKGQEIIESSRQKNLITQVNSLRAALTTFQDRYRAIPGDYSLATTRISADTNFTNGGGNGVVGTSVTSAATTATVDNAAGENVQFFVHMFGARLIEGVSATTAPGTTFGENSSNPATAFPGSGLSIRHGTYDAFATDTRQAHWLLVHRGTTTAAAALSPRQMYALDVKTDDGVPSRGTFRSGLLSNGCGTGGGTADYTASNDQINCIPVIDLVQ